MHVICIMDKNIIFLDVGKKDVVRLLQHHII